jgi:uncharacterized membrane protein
MMVVYAVLVRDTPPSFIARLSVPPVDASIIALGAVEGDILGACEGEALAVGACEHTLSASDGDALATHWLQTKRGR